MARERLPPRVLAARAVGSTPTGSTTHVEITMTNWRRHTSDSRWHTGDENSISFVTHCNGRWSLTDELEGEVEKSDSPPHDERCEKCQREYIDVLRLHEGLRELRDSSTYNTPRAPVFGFDLGGES